MLEPEIALQLTLARLDKLVTVESTNFGRDENIKHNESIAEETYKLYNAILKGIMETSTPPKT